MIKALVLISTLAITTYSFAQTNIPLSKKIAPSLIRSDFLLLRDTLQKIHPGLYRYQNKETMDHIFDSCFASIQDSMTVTDLYALTSFIIGSIGDGHTNCKLPEQFVKEYYSSVKIFPAMVMFIHNKAFVFCCKQNNGLEGAELLSINGHSMDEITQRLFSYIQSDGFIQSHKNWEILNEFQLLFSIVYGEESNYKVTYKTQSGGIESTSLQADILKNVICGSPFPQPDKYLQLTYEGNGVAVLSIKTFFNGFLDKTGENFSKFLDSAFTNLKNKKVRTLLLI